MDVTLVAVLTFNVETLAVAFSLRFLVLFFSHCILKVWWLAG